MKKNKPKFIVVTGGVISGLGKGITTSSIGRLLRDDLKVIPIKCDGYLNTDPGTMNPLEHGEVFVLDDGGEVDMDFGHYERFIGIRARKEWNLTMGRIFQSIIEKERKGVFLGKTVQHIPHVTNEIKGRILEVCEAEKPDVVLIEIGGTVGDMENELYIESARQLRQELGSDMVSFVHLTYIPAPSSLGEQKTKPTQQSVKLLNERGIFPSIIIGRSEQFLTEKVKNKIALFCNIEEEAVISGVDVKTVYENPVLYDSEGITDLLKKKLGIKFKPKLDLWIELVERIKKPSRELEIAIAGKYTALRDAYASLVEALTHAGAHLDCRVNIRWVDTVELEKKKKEINKVFEGVSGLIVPGGFGARGSEGKIMAINYARVNKLPFLGICYGLQLAVVEFARNECGLELANTTELESEGITTPYPVICLLESQKSVKNKGGTMRLGAQFVRIFPGTKLRELYKKRVIRERFRHRYEVNPEFMPTLEKHGMRFSAEGESGIVQAIEIPDHPFFLASQFHPEFLSSLEHPAPLFYGFVAACIEHKKQKK